MNSIEKDFSEALDLLNRFMNSPQNFQHIEKSGEIMVKALSEGNKIISCGNGGSMSDAMHFAEELTGKFRDNRPSVPAISISDPTHLSCVANDYGYDYVFSRYIESIGVKGDVLLCISTSGNSQNVIHAANAAIVKGMPVIGLTGKDGGTLGSLCTVEIRVEHFAYADRIQEIHIKIIHSLMNYIEHHLFNN